MAAFNRGDRVRVRDGDGVVMTVDGTEQSGETEIVYVHWSDHYGSLRRQEFAAGLLEPVGPIRQDGRRRRR